MVVADDPMGLAIDVQQLWKSYDGKPALQGLSLDAREGEIFGLIGPNGAGKTTTLKILVGLLRPDIGVVRVKGNDVLADPVSYKADIGYMPEAPTLPEYLTPGEFLGYVGRIRNLPRDRIASRTREPLAMLDLTGKADDTIASLSKGMKAKLAFAAAIIHEPSTLILDASVLPRAFPPRAVLAVHLPRPDRDLPPVRVLHGSRPRDGRADPRCGRGPHGPERAPRRGPVRRPPVLARRRRHGQSVRVRLLP